MSSQIPLLLRPLSEAFCVFTHTDALVASPPNTSLSKIVSCAEFISDVQRLSSQLPEHSYAINLCSDRYAFLVAFCAVIVRGSTNLLPPNKNAATQSLLAEQYPTAYVVHNGDMLVVDDVEHINVASFLLSANLTELDNAALESIKVPTISVGHLAAISFTSGSTGRSQPNHKTWGSIVHGSAINAQYFLSKKSLVYVLATVPAQHMWGLETSVYLPLFSSVCVSSAQPLFAQDIVNHLHRLPVPRLLVSTPVHLRYLLSSELMLPQIDRVLCATSPLAQTLACQLEAACGGELMEIYGCSEVGSMAYRRTATTEYWTMFDGLECNALGQGETQVVAKHLPVSEIVLQDRLSFIDSTRFQLLGRNSDAINIAGKRGSITEISNLLLAIDHVQDAAVLIVDHRSAGIERLVAVVVADTEKSVIVAALREHLDPVFIPKSLYFVESLPRETSGKLPRKALLEIIGQHTR
ncbi:MAG: acyl-coenzyme A synthetase/AMP-(fatty) acid ligase [Kiritimatiellia bacterium]|jgi:acyl-coenzyme A synthetase/AMP-(fatty) acid ligase